jgi:hypothetical protein
MMEGKGKVPEVKKKKEVEETEGIDSFIPVGVPRARRLDHTAYACLGRQSRVGDREVLPVAVVNGSHTGSTMYVSVISKAPRQWHVQGFM